MPDVAFSHDALDDREHRRRIGAADGLAAPQRPDGQRHRRVGPFGGAALRPVRAGATGPDVRQKLFGPGRARRLGESPTDIDSGVVIGPPDGGAAMGLDVDERREVQFLGAGTIARLPDREQLRQSPPVARRERRLDGVERMRQRGRDLAPVEVDGARLDVIVVSLKPVVVVLVDPIAEDVNRLRLALEPHGQLFGHERVGKVIEREGADDRVVVGDRHEVHPATLGEFVDLFGRGRALGQA